jgi:trimethylamine--corrinoid protein Co-methyltransferase
MTAALLGVSFEAFILDDEMHAMTYRALRGVEVSEENLGFDAICAAILGDGHFLGADHTYQAMERDYHYPKLADREQPRTWEENGALDAWARAKAKAQEVLANHHPEYLTPDQDAQIKAAFKIVG